MRGDDSRTSTSTGAKPRSSFRSAFLIWLSSPAGRRTDKIVPLEEDDAPYRRDHSPGGGRTLRALRSRGPMPAKPPLVTARHCEIRC